MISFIKNDFEQWYIAEMEKIIENMPQKIMFTPTEDINRLEAMKRIYDEYRESKNEH